MQSDQGLDCLPLIWQFVKHINRESNFSSSILKELKNFQQGHYV